MTLRVRRTEFYAALVVVFLLVFTIGAYGLGRALSPRDRAGHPLLMTPNLVWTLDYERQMADWVTRLAQIDGAAHRALLSENVDLYQAASDADALTQEIEAVISEIGLSEAPPAMSSLRTTALATATAYHDAVARISTWIAGPNTALQADAAHSLGVAQAYLAALEGSTWLRK